MKKGMKKRLSVLAAVVVAALLVVFAGLPYYFGIKAEQSLREQQALLAKTGFLTIDSHSYSRGWFTSEEKTVLRFNPSFLSAVQANIPDNLRTVLQQPVTVVNHIRHGLFAGSFEPVRAKVDTEFVFTPDVQKILMRFFGDKAPVQMHNTIALSGGGVLSAQIPAFDYEELSGIKMAWEGLTLNVDYNAGYRGYRTQMTSPGLTLVLADKGTIGFKGLKTDTDSQPGVDLPSVGHTAVSLKQFSVHWNEGIEYSVRLNDLINMVSDLQIGAFINPTGTVAPASVVLDDLNFSSDTVEKNGFADSSGTFTFKKLHYGNEVYGPLDIGVSAEHLDAKSLTALTAKMRALATEKDNADKWQEEVIKAAQTEGLGLFTHDPVFRVRKFDLQTPYGPVRADGYFTFKGLKAEDMQQFGPLLKKTQSDMSFSVPEKMLEILAVNRVSGLFTVDPSVDEKEAMADIAETVRQMVRGTVETMAKEGYIKTENGILSTRLNLKDGRLLLNGKEPAAQQEETYWDNGASAPATPAASAPVAEQ